ncbi:MAG: AsmA family protein [Pseudomonadota bacterium]
MRWIIRAILLLVVLAIGLVATVMMLPGERIARLASDQISNLTGREVTMSGETTISFYPILGVSTGAVTIANADWSDEGPMFQADSLKIGVEPQALWGGDIRITGLEAQSPRVHLERAADGRVNWEVGVEGVAPSGQSGEGAAPAQSSRLALTLDRALIENATFIFDDRTTGERTEMSGMRFDLRWPEYEGRASFDATLRPAGEAVEISGYLDRVGDFIDGAVSDVSADITMPGGTIAFLGRASADGAADGKLTAKISDTNRAMAALGQPPADLPAGFGRAVDVSTQVTFTADQNLSLRDLVLDLGGNRLTGAVDVALAGDRPMVTAKLDAGALDLSALNSGEPAATGGQQASGGQSSAGSSGWSKDPIDASALSLANADIALTASSIDLGDLQVGTTQTRMRLDRSRMVFELQNVQAYSGTITGQFVMNNRSGLSVGGNMNVQGIDLESFLTAAADIDRLSGSADASVNFLGVGQSQHAIMNSLSGDGRVSMGRGVIAGIDLDRLMRSGDITGGTTIFDTMGATFTMQNGNLFNQDLRMELPLAKADGEGRVGVGARDIDYLFTPKLLEGENNTGLAIPVRIRGSWDNPSIVPDLEKALELNLAGEIDELEDQAEEELRRAVGKELGVEVEEGQDIEDVLEDAIKDEALKGLRSLFD